MSQYRRSILDRHSSEWRETNPNLARLVEAYEQELRHRGLIDFDDMPLLAVKALEENDWLPLALLAKYPVLAVDEYQDLGRALHRMVVDLCFGSGVRLLAVGDVDQSIYGFTGAYPELLQHIAERDDVETVRLKFNYRSGSQIVAASEFALGEVRGYRSVGRSSEGAIFFHPVEGTHQAQAKHLFSEILPGVLQRHDLRLGDIAVLYPAAWIGDAVAQAAILHGHSVVRSDNKALYPRSSRLMRWLELCARWCCGGWRLGTPRFGRLVQEGIRLFAEVVVSDEDRLEWQETLMQFLWYRRDSATRVSIWLKNLKAVLADLLKSCRTLDDEAAILDQTITKTSARGEAEAMLLSDFADEGSQGDRLFLSTLHSAKGREFPVVALFGMDNGSIPRNNLSPSAMREARRLFYVGFSRPQQELHIFYTAANPSSFVLDVRQRMGGL